MNLFLVGLLYILIASTFTLSKAIIESISPILLVSIRFLVAGLILGGYLLWKNKSKNVFFIKKEDRNLFFWTGITLYCITFILDNVALKYLSSSISCIIYNLSPFITAIVAYFWFNKKITFYQALGLLIGFVSFMPIFIDQIFHSPSSFNHEVTLTAEFILFLGIIANSVGWLLFYRLLQKGYDSLFINCISLFGSGVVSGLLAVFLHVIGYQQYFRYASSGTPVTGNFLLDLFALIIISHVLSYTLYGFLLRFYSATFLAFAGFTTPLFAALFGYIFLKESINTSFLMTFVFVTFGLYLFYRDEKDDQLLKEEISH
jgi:drug/metabolite transporter (DMT)-like permease